MKSWNQKTFSPWEESYDKPRQHIEKQRHHYADKGPYSQSYGFSCGHVWMWEWTIKKAERWKTDAFKLWCWRRLWRVPWTARRSNHSILKEVNSEYSLEGLKLKLKLQFFGHLMWRADSLEKNLMLRKTEGKRKRWQRLKWFDSITDSMGMNVSKLQQAVEDRGAWHASDLRVTKSETQLSDWTATIHVNLVN